MGIIGRDIPCNERDPKEKHDWHSYGKRRSGHNWREVWRCNKCGATTSNENRLAS
jgi:rubrerythrin